MERKVCFILDVSNQRKRIVCPKPDSPPDNHRAKFLQSEGGGCMPETVQLTLIVILKLVTSGLDCFKYS